LSKYRYIKNYVLETGMCPFPSKEKELPVGLVQQRSSLSTDTIRTICSFLAIVYEYVALKDCKEESEVMD
jgi:hypothetical protein